MGEEAPEHELRIENVRSLLVDLTADDDDETRDEGAVQQGSASSSQKKKKKWTSEELAPWKTLLLSEKKTFGCPSTLDKELEEAMDILARTSYLSDDEEEEAIFDCPIKVEVSDLEEARVQSSANAATSATLPEMADVKPNPHPKSSSSLANTAVSCVDRSCSLAASSRTLTSLFDSIHSSQALNSKMGYIPQEDYSDKTMTDEYIPLENLAAYIPADSSGSQHSTRGAATDAACLVMPSDQMNDRAEVMVERVATSDSEVMQDSCTNLVVKSTNASNATREVSIVRDIRSMKEDVSSSTSTEEMNGNVFFCSMCRTSPVSLLELIAHNCLSAMNIEDKVAVSEVQCRADFSSNNEHPSRSHVQLLCCSKIFQSIVEYKLHHCASSKKLRKYIRFSCQGCRKVLISVTFVSSEGTDASEELYCPHCASFSSKTSQDSKRQINSGKASDTYMSPAANFLCNGCGTVFISQELFKNHTCCSGSGQPVKKSDGRGAHTFSCNLCNSTFHSKFVFNVHICNEVFQCKYCSRHFESLVDRASHKCSAYLRSDVKGRVLEESSAGALCCPQCSKVFREVRILALHMYSCCYRLAIQRVPPLSVTKVTSCAICFQTFNLSSCYDRLICIKCSKLKYDSSNQAHVQHICEVPMYTFQDVDKLCLWCGLEANSKAECQKHLQESLRCLRKTLQARIWMWKHDKCVCCGLALLTGEDTHLRHYAADRWCMYQWLTFMHPLICDTDCWKCVPSGSGGLKDFHCVCCGRLFATSLQRIEHFHYNRMCLKYHLKINPLAFPCLKCGSCFASGEQQHAHGRNCTNTLPGSSCHACKQQFSTISDCENHIRYTPECARSFPCMACSESFGQVEKRAIHFLEKKDCLNQHLFSSFKMFVCKNCFSCFITSDSLSKHVMNVSQCIRVQGGECLKCHKVFADLEGHCRVNAACDEAQRQVAPLGFACWGCGWGYITKEGLNDHMQNSTVCASEERSLWKCTVCSKRFVTFHILKKHCKVSLSCSKGCQGFKCWGCWWTFTTTQTLQEHLAICGGWWKGGWCRVCLRFFNDLEAHCRSYNPCGIVQKAVNPLTFFCWGCSEEFLTRQGLRGHLRDFPQCLRRELSGSLTTAMNCINCLNSFATFASLVQHFMSNIDCVHALQHTRGRGFMCLECMKLLISLAALLEHVKQGPCHNHKKARLPTGEPSPKSVNLPEVSRVAHNTNKDVFCNVKKMTPAAALSPYPRAAQLVSAEHDEHINCSERHHCRCCKKRFEAADILISHYKQNPHCAAQLLKTRLKTFMCTSCQKRFMTLKAYVKHLLISPQCEHPCMVVQMVVYNHLCLCCAFSSRNPEAWQHHFDLHPQCAAAANVDVCRLEKIDMGKMYACSNCKCLFKSKESRKNHFTSNLSCHSRLLASHVTGPGSVTQQKTNQHPAEQCEISKLNAQNRTTILSTSPEIQYNMLNHCFHSHNMTSIDDFSSHLKALAACDEGQGQSLCKVCGKCLATKADHLHHRTCTCPQLHRQKSLSGREGVSDTSKHVMVCSSCCDASVLPIDGIHRGVEKSQAKLPVVVDEPNVTSSQQNFHVHGTGNEEQYSQVSSTQEMKIPYAGYDKTNGDLQISKKVPKSCSTPSRAQSVIGEVQHHDQKSAAASGQFQKEGVKALTAQKYIEVIRTDHSDVEILEVNPPEARSETYCCSLCHVNMDFADMDAEQQTSEHLICTKCSIKSEKPALEGEEQGFLCTKCNKILTVDTLESHSCAIFSGSGKASEGSREMMCHNQIKETSFRETNHLAPGHHVKSAACETRSPALMPSVQGHGSEFSSRSVQDKQMDENHISPTRGKVPCHLPDAPPVLTENKQVSDVSIAQFPCMVCGEMFIEAMLEQHMMVHMGAASIPVQEKSVPAQLNVYKGPGRRESCSVNDNDEIKSHDSSDNRLSITKSSNGEAERRRSVISHCCDLSDATELDKHTCVGGESKTCHYCLHKMNMTVEVQENNSQNRSIINPHHQVKRLDEILSKQDVLKDSTINTPLETHEICWSENFQQHSLIVSPNKSCPDDQPQCKGDSYQLQRRAADALVVEKFIENTVLKECATSSGRCDAEIEVLEVYTQKGSGENQGKDREEKVTLLNGNDRTQASSSDLEIIFDNTCVKQEVQKSGNGKEKNKRCTAHLESFQINEVSKETQKRTDSSLPNVTGNGAHQIPFCKDHIVAAECNSVIPDRRKCVIEYVPLAKRHKLEL